MNNKDIEKNFLLSTLDKNITYTYCWDDVTSPKGVVQIFHGMAEHAGRYREFAKFLNKHGLIVYASDHRGHGKTVESIKDLGYIGQDGFNKIVEDGHQLKKIIQDKHKGLPIFIFAHSFGSFIGQEYIIKYGSEISGIILSGSAARTGIDVHAGSFIALIQKTIFGEDKKSRLLDFLTFLGYNKKIREVKSRFDWLTTDSKEVINYENDPLCGNVFSAGFYFYFLNALKKLYKKDRLAQIPKKLPIFIVSGKEDPVGNYGKWVQKLYHIYDNNKISNLKIKLYEKKRHELINEQNKEDFYMDIVNWIHENSSY